MCDTMGAVQDKEGFEESYRLLREDCGVIELAGMRAVAYTGEDRKGWLQGQVTNDLRKLEPGGSIFFCQCKPTGQIEAIATQWNLPDRLISLSDVEGAQALLNRVERNVILEDVQASQLDVVILTVQGPEATRALSKLFSLPALDAGTAEYDGTEVLVLRSNRSGYGGWDLLLPSSATKTLKKLRKAFPPLTEEAFDVARLEAGIPIFGRDCDDKTLPPEMGSAFLGTYVSFAKGCYTGQEVLMRINSRGHTNRTWVGLISDEPLLSGDAVRQGTRDVGQVTRAGFSPDYGFIAAAMLRNESAFAGEIVRIAREGSEIDAEVAEMPILRFG